MGLEPVSTTYVPLWGVVSVRTKGINRSPSNSHPRKNQKALLFVGLRLGLVGLYMHRRCYGTLDAAQIASKMATL